MNAPERAPDGVEPEEATRRETGLPGVPEGAGRTGAPLTDEKALTDELEALRSILVDPERERVARLEVQVAELDVRTQDRDVLIAAITPVLGDVIRRKIRDSREEMIEALYPILAQLIGRAVSEAIRDLARTIDTRMRMSFSPRSIGRRLRARMAGISESELVLRDALPFRVAELFLIQRDSGLLLRHLSNGSETAADSDLISGMLTAIRDFAQDAFGRGQEGQLDEIQYGTRRILIEASRHAYLAAVVDGVEPPGFRATLRDRIIAFENEYSEALDKYDGDASRFTSADALLAQLITGAGWEVAPSGQEMTSGQRRIAVALVILLIACLLAACVGSILTVRSALNRPAPAVFIVVTATPGPTDVPSLTAILPPTATALPPPTAMPTAIATSTATPMSRPTATRTPIPRPTGTSTLAPNPTARVSAAGVNVRKGPGLRFAVLETATLGQTYTIVGRDASGGWLKVCCTRNGEVGWLVTALVETQGTAWSAPVVPGE
jgi:hypothetical protein